MDQILSVKKTVRLQYWQKRIDEFNSSGMFLKEWLEQNNITKDTYYYWLRKCRTVSIETLPAEIKSQLPDEVNSQLPVTAAKPKLKKLEVTSPVPNMQAAVIVRLPYATIEVTNDATQRTVEAVLLALKSTC